MEVLPSRTPEKSATKFDGLNLIAMFFELDSWGLKTKDLF
jgi:hypothetical protein